MKRIKLNRISQKWEKRFSVEASSGLVGFLMALTFSFAINTSDPLIANYEFIYPLHEISKLECIKLDWEQQDDACKRMLPTIDNANYGKYANDPVYQAYYSVLWGGTYENGWDNHQGGHLGVDISASPKTPVLSMGQGKVVFAGWQEGYGNVVKIAYKLPNDKVIYGVYAHLTSYSVGLDDMVIIGQEIGRVGSTGNSTGPHLHREIVTTTSWGKPSYAYLECETKDFIAQANGACRAEMMKHTMDPIALAETYAGDHGTRVDTVASLPNDFENTSKKGESNDPTKNYLEPIPVALPDDIGNTINSNLTLPAPRDPTIQRLVPTDISNNSSDPTTLNTSPLYHLITDKVPPFDTSKLSAKAASFFDEYKVQIVHSLNTSISEGKQVDITLKVSRRSDDQVFDGRLPISIDIIPNNDKVKVNPGNVSYVSNGSVNISILGYQPGASFVTVIVDNQIYYAFPVVIQ